MEEEFEKERFKLDNVYDHYVGFHWAIKRLLRQKANFGVLEGFLKVMLGENMKILEILGNEENGSNVGDKFYRTNIKALNAKGEIVIVEIHNIREIHYRERLLQDVEHPSLEWDFSGVKKIYFIILLYFDIGKGEDYVYQWQNHFIGVHTGDLLQMDVKQFDAIMPPLPVSIFFEYILVRIKEFNGAITTSMDEWMEYLRYGTIRPDTTVPGLVEACKVLKYYSLPPQERHAYDEYITMVKIQNDALDTAKLEGKIEGRAEGLEESLAKGKEVGKEEGITEGKILMARNLKKMGVPVDVIIASSGLTAEEIQNLDSL